MSYRSAIRSGLLLIGLLATMTASAKDESDRAIKLAKQWQSHNGTTILNPNGRVLFVYGESQPTVVCALFSLCDIALEPGEVINTVNLGDTVRWNINPARVGEGDFLEEHLIVKPTAVGLRTTLFIGTNRRSYMIELRSHESDSMGKVGFLYGGVRPQPSRVSPVRSAATDQRSTFSDIALLPPPIQADRLAEEPNTAPLPDSAEVIAGNLDFNYRITGDRVAWRPLRVYDDGVRTYIDFNPERVTAAELPVFLVNDTNQRGAMINHRYADADARIIVDGLFNKGSLILGVGKGRRSNRVWITRVKGDRS